MDVQRGQPHHLGKRMMGKPDAIAFVPPKGLKVEAGDAQSNASRVSTATMSASRGALERAGCGVTVS